MRRVLVAAFVGLMIVSSLTSSTTAGMLAAAGHGTRAMASNAADECAGRSLESLGRFEAKSTQPLPFGSAPCPGVRPGAVLGSAGCTLNFLFKGSNGHQYIGTAGHCVLSGEGEEKWKQGTGPEATDADDKRFGEFVYAINVLGPPEHDFGLIRIDKGIETSAKMCYWGGPTGINQELTEDAVTLRYFGNGNVIGREWTTRTQTLAARTARATNLSQPDYIKAHGVASFGDSGSPVISEDGRAAGVFVDIYLVPAEATIGITRIAPQIKLAEEALGLKLRLLTAKVEE